MSTMQNITTSMLDRLGISASVLCAVHCAVLPMIIGVLPALGLQMLMHGVVEGVMILLAAVVGGFSLGHSYRSHGLRAPMLLLGAGITVLIANFLGHEFGSHAFEPIHPYAAVGGGALIVTAHFINLRYHARHGECTTDGEHVHAGAE